MEKVTARWMEKIRNMKKNQWFILVLIGILILVIAIPVNPGSEEETAETAQTSAETAAGTDDLKYLEQRLEKALGDVAGVGRVQVMLTRKSSGEKRVEKDIPVSDANTQEEDSDGGKRTSSERTTSEATVYTQDANGGQTPYVVEELEPQIAGVVVVAEGGDQSTVVQNITEAVVALFGVDVHKIKVMKMN